MARAARSSSKAPSFDATMRVVILRGPDAYLREAYTKQLAAALEGAHGEIGVFTFDGEKTEPADVLDELRSYGLLQTHKLVIVDHADKLLAADDDDGGAKRRTPRQLFERYAAEPADGATLLLRAATWRPGKLDKAVEAIGAVVKCDEPSPATAIKWAIGRVQKEHGCILDRPAAALLVERMGPNLTRLDTELGKLAASVGAGGTIDRDVVMQMVGMTREEKAWLIQSAVLSRQPAVALGKLRELLEVSQIPEQLLSWSLVDLLRKLHVAAQLLAQGTPPGTVAKELRLWGPERDVVLNVARRQSPAALADLLHQAILSDRGPKRGVGKSRRNLEVLTVRIADTLCG